MEGFWERKWKIWDWEFEWNQFGIDWGIFMDENGVIGRLQMVGGKNGSGK